MLPKTHTRSPLAHRPVAPRTPDHQLYAAPSGSELPLERGRQRAHVESSSSRPSPPAATDELLSIQVETVRVLPHASLDHRRREQVGDVQHTARARDRFDPRPTAGLSRFTTTLVSRVQFAHEQSRLQSAQVVALDARDCHCPGQSRLLERLGSTRAEDAKMRDLQLPRHRAPAEGLDRRPRSPHGGPRGVQLLDRCAIPRRAVHTRSRVQTTTGRSPGRLFPIGPQ